MISLNCYGCCLNSQLSIDTVPAISRGEFAGVGS